MSDYKNENIILFDGFCNLCSGVVVFVLKREKNNTFKFASLQSSFGKNILASAGLNIEEPGTFVYLENGKAFTMSTAALKVAKKLSGPYPLLYIFILIPPFIRNIIYKFIARNRYKWFGKKEYCWIPPYNMSDRFYD